MSVACRLADELGQAFGVPEMGQLSPAGEIRRKYWNHELQAQIVAWADANNITVTQDTEAYAKLGDELCDHVADLRGRQFLIMLSRGFA